jgi:hypothetical protein
MYRIPVLLLCALLVLCCHDDELLDVGDQPRVQYTVVVTDSATGAPVGDVRVRLTQINNDTSTWFTDSASGKVEFDEIESSRNFFSFDKEEYFPLDTIDDVTDKNDSIFDIPIMKILRVRLVSRETVFADSMQNIQYRILIRDNLMNHLTDAVIEYNDSLGIARKAIDEDEDGKIIITSLGLGSHYILVKHHGYLGQNVNVTMQRGPNDSVTSRFVETFPVTLLPLGNQLSGTVFHKAPGMGEIPLEGAKVVFVLNDTLSVPHSFSAFSDSSGEFFLDSLPRLSGLLEYFLDESSVEPGYIREVTVDELALAGPLDPVVLDPLKGESGLPILLSPPPDTISFSDPLVFTFNQAVDAKEAVVEVRLVNSPQILLTPWTLSDDGKTLEVSLQENSHWIQGVLYQYFLSIENELGESFNVPGSTSGTINGYFFVRDSLVPEDELLFPFGFFLPYFSSGTDPDFDSIDVNSSPYGDSTSNMVRLKWKLPEDGNGKVLVDSLSVYIRESANFPEWSLWTTLPARLDSFTLFFSDIYGTKSFPSPTKPVFPLLAGDSLIELQVIPKHGRRIFFDSAVILDPVTQGMGPRVYVSFTDTDSLFYGPGPGGDTIGAVFLFDPDDDTSYVRFKTKGYEPGLLSNYEFSDDDIFTWEWDAGYSGFIIYDVIDNKGLRFKTFSLDITGAQVYDREGDLVAGKPVWFMDRNKKVTINE